MQEGHKLIAILSGASWVGGSIDFIVVPDEVIVPDAHEVVEKMCPHIPLERFLREACHGRYASPDEVEIYCTGINPSPSRKNHDSH